MAENKTKATDASVEDYLAAIDDEARRKDCGALADLMAKATKQPPRMWGARSSALVAITTGTPAAARGSRASSGSRPGRVTSACTGSTPLPAPKNCCRSSASIRPERAACTSRDSATSI